MRRLASVLALASAAACGRSAGAPSAVTSAAPSNGAPEIAGLPLLPPLDRQNLDTSCSPCRDFYRFANGGWLDRNPIPPAYAAWSSFNEATDRNNQILKQVLERAARSAETTRDADVRKLGRFYTTCMDSARADRERAAPLQPELERIALVYDKREIPAELGRLHAAGLGGGFAFFALEDPRDANVVIAHLGQGGLGLPNRDYYFRTDSASAKTRENYVAYVTRLFELLGDVPDSARVGARRVLAFETALAEGALAPVELRDPKKADNPATRDELSRMTPAFDWNAYLGARGAPAIDRVNVRQPKFLQQFDAALAQRPIEEWRAYLRVRTVHPVAPWLGSAFQRAHFTWQSSLSGAREPLPRWQRCLQATDNLMGDALGREFVKVAFTPEAKARMQEMMANVRAVLRGRLERLDWMSDSTKRQALVKLEAFGQKIGYPERWRDYSALSVERGTFAANLRAASRFDDRLDMAKIGKAPDRNEWSMTPPTVNAYYNPFQNEIAFPAGRLQPPFFHFSYDDAANYGGIGGTIGHEILHGFDDAGRQFDAAGNLRDWWTPQDAAQFKARADAVVAQYDAYRVLDTLSVNGRLTLGENIADIAGLSIAYEALQLALKGKPRETVDGFTPEQRFFLAYAQARRAAFRPQQMRLMVQNDPHAPNMYRVIGPLSNMPEFAEAFGCKAGDRMVRPETERVRIW
ncbi:MAG TPA: M13 family metallopeptidase [Gemmatimonadaceae bacterium]|nr:M13 family metallopeptidase [Gemmatimonadaceae bacterium]